jgi:archaellum biogenesis ATPase FlaH
MQTLTVNVHDNFLQDFLNFVDCYKDKVQLQKDKNLAIDPYFYDRQQQLQQDIEDIDNGTAIMISHNDMWNNVNNYLKSLK